MDKKQFKDSVTELQMQSNSVNSSVSDNGLPPTKCKGINLYDEKVILSSTSYENFYSPRACAAILIDDSRKKTNESDAIAPESVLAEQVCSGQTGPHCELNGNRNCCSQYPSKSITNISKVLVECKSDGTNNQENVTSSTVLSTKRSLYLEDRCKSLEIELQLAHTNFLYMRDEMRENHLEKDRMLRAELQLLQEHNNYLNKQNNHLKRQITHTTCLQNAYEAQCEQLNILHKILIEKRKQLMEASIAINELTSDKVRLKQELTFSQSLSEIKTDSADTFTEVPLWKMPFDECVDLLNKLQKQYLKVEKQMKKIKPRSKLYARCMHLSATNKTLKQQLEKYEGQLAVEKDMNTVKEQLRLAFPKKALDK